MKKDLYAIKCKPTILLKDVKTIYGEKIDEINYDFINEVYVIKYRYESVRDYNVVIVESQVDFCELEDVRNIGGLILNYKRRNCNDGCDSNNTEIYSNMKLRLSNYQLSFERPTTFYYVFANDYVKDSVIKKELNDIIDKNIQRERNEKLYEISNNVNEMSWKINNILNSLSNEMAIQNKMLEKLQQDKLNKDIK